MRSPSAFAPKPANTDRKSTRLNSSHRCTTYAVFCLKKEDVDAQADHRAHAEPERGEVGELEPRIQGKGAEAHPLPRLRKALPRERVFFLKIGPQRRSPLFPHGRLRP